MSDVNLSHEVPGGSVSLVFTQRAGGPAAVANIEAKDSESTAQLLAWTDSTARGHAQAPTLLCVENPGSLVEAVLISAGFDLAVAEDELRRAAAALPATLLEGLAAHAWSEGAAPLFHHAYFESFRERPGFPAWEEDRWRAAFCADGDFRPDLSRVILDGPEPAAFAVLWLEDEIGWVTQMGVRPGWRGKGLGEALLRHALTAFAAEGVETVALEVATNNAAARALYERMGFSLFSSHRSWRKPLA